jgi:FixJ family two-component response regulator
MAMDRQAPVVFLVDDDESVRRSLQRLLGSHGYRTEEYAAASDFIDAVHDEGASCAVLDLHLPGVDGLALQRRLSDLPYLIPVVFVTGYGDVSVTVEAMKQGASDFLTKPFSEEDLLRAVSHAIEQSRTEIATRAESAAARERVLALTPREFQVFREVVTGKLNKQIAAGLGIAEKTVKIHRQRVMQKTGVRSVAELVRLADRVLSSSH